MPSARETLKNYLVPFGLGEAKDVLDAVWKFAQDNPSLVNNTDLLVGSARNTATYKARFKGNEERVKKGLPELNPQTYLQYEDAYKATLRRAGMPVGFYDDQNSLTAFIANDTDPNELGERIQLGYQAVRNADPQILAEFKRLYPVTDGDLAAYFIDPNRAKPTFDKYEAQRQAQSAAIAAEAQKQAAMTLTQQEAESLQRQGIGAEAARQGFGAIQQTQGLFEAQMAGEQAVSREEQIGAAFGTNAAAQQRIASRRRRRQAEFEAGGGLTTTQQGVTGLRTVGQ